MTNQGLQAKIDFLPDEPGVYVFRNRKGEVIYVGKAKSLRDRVRSYFQTSALPTAKGQLLRSEIDDVEVNLCRNEVEALILESNLIKKYKPRFNVMLRDDKSYPYIALTLADEFPRVAIVRGKKIPGTKYFGPYVNVKAARNTVRLLHNIFPLRQCKGKFPGRRNGSPCLYKDIGMCLGPCTGEVPESVYEQQVKQFSDFLEGRGREVIQQLEAEMLEASRNLQFEKAARIKKKIESARMVIAHPKSASRYGDYDVIGMYSDGLEVCFSVSENRGGIDLGNPCFFSDLEDELPDEELIEQFIKKHYDMSGRIPREIVVRNMGEEGEAIEEWLASQKGGKVRITVPKRGRKAEALALAEDNARFTLESEKERRARDRQKLDTALRELKERLHLKKYPLRIECFDISTMGGSASVGSMIVFEEGLPRRQSYRRFKIKFTPGIDDVGMMREVILRRFKRYLRARDELRDDREFEKLPDLLLLDGGKGQLGAAKQVLDTFGIKEVEIAAIAKRFEEIYRPKMKMPIRLEGNSEAMFLLQRVRDEAHRFAVTYNRALMKKGTKASWLDEVDGVGPARKKILISHFGSPEKVALASLEEIESVEGIPKKVAMAVHNAARRVGVITTHGLP